MLLKSQGKKTLSRSFQKVKAGKPLLSIFGYVSLFFCGLGFILVNRDHSYEHLKTVLLDLSGVTLAAVESPLSLITDVKKTLSYYDVVKNNAKLTEELQQSNKNLQHTINTLQFRLDDLQGILDIHDSSLEAATTFSCFGQHSSASTGYIFIHGGTQQNINRNAPVFGQGVLLGLIDKIGNSASRIMLLSHQKSRIPIVSESSKIEGILCGSDSGMVTNSTNERKFSSHYPEPLTIQFVNHPENFKVGESIFTSGTDGVIPRGLFIGKVSKVTPDFVYVQRATDPQSQKFLQIHKSSSPLLHTIKSDLITQKDNLDVSQNQLKDINQSKNDHHIISNKTEPES